MQVQNILQEQQMLQSVSSEDGTLHLNQLGEQSALGNTVQTAFHSLLHCLDALRQSASASELVLNRMLAHNFWVHS